MTENIREKIRSQIESNDIIIYMKGTPDVPMCGFSAQIVNIFKFYKIPFETVDVLEDPEIRQGIKDHSNWPTIPQVYIKGNFIGGCDICVDLHEKGELEKIARAAVST